MPKKILLLTPNEKQRAEQEAYQAWLARMATYSPPPEPDTTDLVHESAWVVRAMTGAVAMLPVLLALIGLAAVTISSDKTMYAFSQSVANKNSLWGAWAVFVAFMAVLMVEGGLIFSEFGAVRDNLKKGLKRRVWTVASLKRAWNVRLGKEEPLDYSEMPDSTLKTYSRFMFILVLMANTYGVLHAYTGDGKTLTNLAGTEYLELVMFMFVGIAGAISLRLIGAQLAHMVYDLMSHRRAEEAHELREEWRESLMSMWVEDGGKIIAEALHQKFLIKNCLDPGAQSPYLLTAGLDENGELELQTTPLVTSYQSSGQLWPPVSANRNGDGPETP